MIHKHNEIVWNSKNAVCEDHQYKCFFALGQKTGENYMYIRFVAIKHISNGWKIIKKTKLY